MEQTAEGLQVSISNAAGSIAQLQMTTSGLALAVNNQKLKFDSSGLSIYNGGFAIYNNYNQPVLAADSQGNLEMTGNVTADSGQIGRWKINANGLAYDTNVYMAPALDPPIRLENFYVSDKGIGYISSTSDKNWAITAATDGVDINTSDWAITSSPGAISISASKTINLSAEERLNLTSTKGRLTFNGYTVFTGELIQAGRKSIERLTWTEVGFNKPFSSGNPPKVVLTPNTTETGVIGVKIRNITNTGFLASVNTDSAQWVTCDWIAVRT